MKNAQDFHAPRNLSLKKYLIGLNKKLDYVKYSIKGDYEYNYGSSLPCYGDELLNIEHFVLRLEDKYFFDHHGVELRSIPRLVKRYIRTRRIGGISTIEQQSIRVILNRRERTFFRKVQELFLAYLLNFHCSKRMILRYYLNNAYFGYALKGCDEASMHAFGVRAAHLSPRQAAFIASLLPRPLPRTMFIDLAKRLHLPSDPQEIIDDARGMGLSWADNIEFRYNYALTR